MKAMNRLHLLVPLLAITMVAAPVSCKERSDSPWGDPATLSGGLLAAEDLQVAFGPKGAEIAAWSSKSEDQLQRIFQTAPGQTPRAISNLSSVASEPSLAFGPKGEATIVWQDYSGSWSINESSKKSGRFTIPSLLASWGRATGPDVAFLQDGATTAAWRNRGAIKQATRAPGDNLFAWPATDVSLGRATSDPEVVATENNKTMILWQQAGSLFSSLRPYPSSPFLAASSLGKSDQTSFSVDSGPEGRLLAAWSKGGVMVASFASGTGAWQKPQPLSAGSDAISPSVAFSESGRALVAWQERREEGWRIVASLWSGGKWLEPQTIPCQGDCIGAGAAMGSDGRGAVLWQETQNWSSFSLHSSLLRAESEQLGPAFLLGQSSAESFLAFSPSGSAVAIWSKQEEESVCVMRSAVPSRYFQLRSEVKNDL